MTWKELSGLDGEHMTSPEAAVNHPRSSSSALIIGVGGLSCSLAFENTCGECLFFKNFKIDQLVP